MTLGNARKTPMKQNFQDTVHYLPPYYVYDFKQLRLVVTFRIELVLRITPDVKAKFDLTRCTYMHHTNIVSYFFDFSSILFRADSIVNSGWIWSDGFTYTYE